MARLRVRMEVDGLRLLPGAKAVGRRLRNALAVRKKGSTAAFTGLSCAACGGTSLEAEQ